MPSLVEGLIIWLQYGISAREVYCGIQEAKLTGSAEKSEVGPVRISGF